MRSQSLRGQLTDAVIWEAFVEQPHVAHTVITASINPKTGSSGSVSLTWTVSRCFSMLYINQYLLNLKQGRRVERHGRRFHLSAWAGLNSDCYSRSGTVCLLLSWMK